MSAEKQEAAAQTRLQWLDDELRQAKASLQKMERELEQALHQIWNLESGLKKLEESVGDSRGMGAALPGIQEDIRQLRGQASQLQDTHNVIAAQTEERGRQQQAELASERQERATVLSKVEAAARSVDQFESRLRLLEESLRRVEEAAAGVRSAQQTLARDVEELASKADRNAEAALRLDHQANAVAADVEALQKRDGELDDKLDLFEQRVRRQEERVEKFESHLSLPLEIKEQLDRSRFERQQLSERLGKLEGIGEDLLERTAEFVQSVARLDQRTQGQATSLLEMAEELRRQRETVGDQIQRFVRVMERQRRRQADALAQEIKELSRSEFNSEQ